MGARIIQPVDVAGEEPLEARREEAMPGIQRTKRRPSIAASCSSPKALLAYTSGRSPPRADRASTARASQQMLPAWMEFAFCVLDSLASKPLLCAEGGAGSALGGVLGCGQQVSQVYGVC